MCETLFYTVKYVVTEIDFWVANEIVALAPKGVYAGSLINKLRYCPKSVPGDLTDWNFAYKEVGDVEMFGDATEHGRLFRIFCLKYPDYAMKIMALCLTIDDMEGVNTKHNWKGRDGESQVKIFTCQ